MRIHRLGVLGCLPGLLVCASLAANRGTHSATGLQRLSLELEGSRHQANEPIVGRLVVENSGSLAIIIVKPRLPTAWSVHYDPGQVEAGQTWEGSVLKGTADPGHAGDYDLAEYVTIAPGREYEQRVDIGWFLRNNQSTIPVGAY